MEFIKILLVFFSLIITGCASLMKDEEHNKSFVLPSEYLSLNKSDLNAIVLESVKHYSNVEFVDDNCFIFTVTNPGTGRKSLMAKSCFLFENGTLRHLRRTYSGNIRLPGWYEDIENMKVENIIFDKVKQYSLALKKDDLFNSKLESKQVLFSVSDLTGALDKPALHKLNYLIYAKNIKPLRAYDKIYDLGEPSNYFKKIIQPNYPFNNLRFKYKKQYSNIYLDDFNRGSKLALPIEISSITTNFRPNNFDKSNSDISLTVSGRKVELKNLTKSIIKLNSLNRHWKDEITKIELSSESLEIPPESTLTIYSRLSNNGRQYNVTSNTLEFDMKYSLGYVINGKTKTFFEKNHYKINPFLL